MNKMDKIPLFRVIYNVGCTDVSYDDEFFSQLFLKTYHEKFGNDEVELYFSTRYNPKVLEIYDLLGAKSNCCPEIENCYSSLKILYFPVELKKYLEITTFNDREMVVVDESKIYKEFYDRVVKNNESVEEIKSYFQRLEHVKNTYNKHYRKEEPNHEFFNYIV